ncbi:MAG: hypothetical protein CUN57_03665, partial [Phototrophicales bacterium]
TTRIKEGMTVYTDTNEKLGTVEFVKYGDEDLSRPGAETATPGYTDDDSPSLIKAVARALVDDDELPEELRSHLLRYGYLRLDTGTLFESDYYVPFNLVTRITGDNVY